MHLQHVSLVVRCLLVYLVETVQIAGQPGLSAPAVTVWLESINYALDVFVGMHMQTACAAMLQSLQPPPMQVHDTIVAPQQYHACSKGAVGS